MPKTSKKLERMAEFLLLFGIRIVVEELPQYGKKKYTILSSQKEILAIYHDVDSLYRWAKSQLEKT